MLPVYSGVLATGGDVVFYGTMDGWFKALDARTGTELWKFHTASGIVGNPITYLGPDGKQYVAIYSGIGGWMGAVAFPDDLGRRSLRRARRRRRHEGHQEVHGAGEHGVCLRLLTAAPAFAVDRGHGGPARCRGRRHRQRTHRPRRGRCTGRCTWRWAQPRQRSRRLAAGSAGAARLRRSEQPAVLERSRRKASRTPSRRWSRASCSRTRALLLAAAAARLHPQHAEGAALRLVHGLFPAPFEMARPTRPYYRSSYVFVARRDRRLPLRSLDDPALRRLSIGVQIVGDDYDNPPPLPRWRRGTSSGTCAASRSTATTRAANRRRRSSMRWRMARSTLRSCGDRWRGYYAQRRRRRCR